MKRCLLLIFLIVIVWVGDIGISYAGIKRGIELSLYGGPLFARDGETHTVNQNREIKTEIEEEGYTGGIRAAYNFNPYLALEVSFEPLSTNVHKITLIDAGDEVSTEITEGEGFFYGNFTIHMLKGRVVPFVTAGGGWIMFVDDNSFAYNYGCGMKIFLFDRVALRLDVREFNTSYNGSISDIREIYLGWYQSGLVKEEVPFTDELNFRQITLGISYFIQ